MDFLIEHSWFGGTIIEQIDRNDAYANAYSSNL